MLAILDFRSSKVAIKNLEKYAEVLLFKSDNIVHPHLDGHPDLFIYQDSMNLVLAPNTPPYIVERIDQINAKYIFGKAEIAEPAASSCFYNCVSTGSHFIHHPERTDESIKEINQAKVAIHTKQAFTRCSLTALASELFLTSDRNIEKVLLRAGLKTEFIDPAGISLPGYQHGLFGGTNGVLDRKIFFNGSLKTVDLDGQIRRAIENVGFEVVELHDGQLYDGGSIFFIEC